MAMRSQPSCKRKILPSPPACCIAILATHTCQTFNEISSSPGSSFPFYIYPGSLFLISVLSITPPPFLNRPSLDFMQVLRFFHTLEQNTSMKVIQGKFLRACLRKCRKLDTKAISPAPCDRCWQLLSSRSVRKKKKTVPRDVPKGHLAIYVGEFRKRFVIKITLLDHPLFRALLDHAQEVYDFTADSKLCIPCDESIFLSVVRCATSPENQPICISL